jgi:hypothetical protein
MSTTGVPENLTRLWTNHVERTIPTPGHSRIPTMVVG